MVVVVEIDPAEADKNQPAGKSMAVEVDASTVDGIKRGGKAEHSVGRIVGEKSVADVES